MSSSLKGKIAVVTGGSRGIGRAVCEKLAELGATVIVNFASSSQAADAVVTQIKTDGGVAETLGFDISSEEQVEKAFSQILDRHGAVHILVNNAGIALDGLIVRTKQEQWTRTLDVNLSGCFYCSRAVTKSMMKAREGRIINISSVIGQMGNAGQVAYAASKAGMIGFTKSLARELASRGITVNAVAPGYIETEMTGALDGATKESIISSVPLNRIGTGSDVASAVAFLAGPEASYITGQVLAVNGGMYM